MLTLGYSSNSQPPSSRFALGVAWLGAPHDNWLFRGSSLLADFGHDETLPESVAATRWLGKMRAEGYATPGEPALLSKRPEGEGQITLDGFRVERGSQLEVMVRLFDARGPTPQARLTLTCAAPDHEMRVGHSS